MPVPLPEQDPDMHSSTYLLLASADHAERVALARAEARAARLVRLRRLDRRAATLATRARLARLALT
jgi:ADP-ribose pyrophosphatase YjhB (NUDIX family)